MCYNRLEAGGFCRSIQEERTLEKVISVDIPEQWLKGLDWDQGALVQETIKLGTYPWKIRRAPEM
jgi:hypothetical protein